MNRPLRKSRLFIPGFLFPVLVLLVSPLAAQCQVRSLHQDNGPNAAAIQGAVEAFRADLGASNGAQPGSFPQGRREINWDRVPDNSASPNSLPADFFNTASPRGAILSTPGTGFEVSATADSGVPVRFGNRNAGYASEFSTFSAERLFTSIGSPITEVEFFIPGTSTPALVSGFGAIFSDSEREGSIVFFNPLGGQVFSTSRLATNSSGSLSFVGVSFSEPCIRRVRIQAPWFGCWPSPPSQDDDGNGLHAISILPIRLEGLELTTRDIFPRPGTQTDP